MTVAWISKIGHALGGADRAGYGAVLLLAIIGVAFLLPRPSAAPVDVAGRPADASGALANQPSEARVNPLQLLAKVFVANRGQDDERVAFTHTAGPLKAYFTGANVTYSLHAPVADEGTSKRVAPAHQPAVGRWSVRVEQVGARQSPPLGEDAREGIVSFFHGSPEAWVTSVPTFGAVRFVGAWPGIDVAYTAHDGTLESTYLVQPGADPQQIRLLFTGMTDAQVDERGRLILGTGLGPLVETKPIAFQQIDDVRSEVPASWRIEPMSDLGGDLATFAVGAYDPRYPLVIDPRVFPGGYVGGNGDDQVTGVAVDDSGLVYVAGQTSSTSQSGFPTAVGPDISFNGASDAFVGKIGANLDAIVYLGFIGGSASDGARAVALVPGCSTNCEAYVAGTTRSSQVNGFPVVNGPDKTHNGGRDGFVASLNGAGTALVYAGYIGGDRSDDIEDLAVDTSGAAYVGGWTYSGPNNGFPVLDGPNKTHAGQADGFVAKVRPDGSGLVYAGYIGSTGSDVVRGVAVDLGGSLYVAGETRNGTSFRTRVGPETLTASGYEGFVGQILPDGTDYVFMGFIGGAGEDSARSVAIPRGCASSCPTFVAGVTNSTPAGGFPVTAGPDPTYHGGTSEAFVAKINPRGLGFGYLGYLGGTADDGVAELSNQDPTGDVPDIRDTVGIAVDARGNAIVVGRTASNRLAAAGAENILDATNHGGQDVFMAYVPVSGANVRFSGMIGGAFDDQPRAVVFNRNATLAYVVGDTATSFGNHFPIDASSSFDPIFNGGPNDGFLLAVKIPSAPTGTGTFVLAPERSAVRSGQHQPLSLIWTVPEPRVWRNLRTIDLRLHDGNLPDDGERGDGSQQRGDEGDDRSSSEARIPLWVRWTEADNSFALVNPRTGALGPAGQPGSTGTLTGSSGTLYLAESSVTGSGPTGRSVTLVLSVSLERRAGDGEYRIEVAATDDLGNSDRFERAGQIDLQIRR